MAFTVSNLSAEPRAWSVGPFKAQILTFTAASGDTTGTITADRLSRVDAVIVCGGVVLSAQPTISATANTATVAFADPLATVAGQIIVFGR